MRSITLLADSSVHEIGGRGTGGTGGTGYFNLILHGILSFLFAPFPLFFFSLHQPRSALERRNACATSDSGEFTGVFPSPACASTSVACVVMRACLGDNSRRQKMKSPNTGTTTRGEYPRILGRAGRLGGGVAVAFALSGRPILLLFQTNSRRRDGSSESCNSRSKTGKA